MVRQISYRSRGTSRKRLRRGAVSVEFALVAPVMVLIMAGMVEAGRLIDTQMMMATAAREGARLASMDRDGLATGTSTNAKIEQDVKNFLAAAGVDETNVTVNITAVGEETAFDLDDPDTSQDLFELSVETPYSSALGLGPDTVEDRGLRASVVFRNGRLTN
jgi:Flp pilus assembly protein TadG